MLKCTTTTTRTIVDVDSKDLDQFVNEVFKIPAGQFDFVAGHEAENARVYHFMVDKTPAYDPQIEKWIGSGCKSHFHGFQPLLCYMAQQGLIEPGHYKVKVSW